MWKIVEEIGDTYFREKKVMIEEAIGRVVTERGMELALFGPELELWLWHRCFAPWRKTSLHDCKGSDFSVTEIFFKVWKVIWGRLAKRIQGFEMGFGSVIFKGQSFPEVQLLTSLLCLTFKTLKKKICIHSPSLFFQIIWLKSLTWNKNCISLTFKGLEFISFPALIWVNGFAESVHANHTCVSFGIGKWIKW